MSQRCQHSGPRGNCSRPRVPGSDFCSSHCSEADRIKGYQLADPDLQRSYEEFHASSVLDNVRAEIALCRTLIQERINLATSEADKKVLFQTLPAVNNSLDKLVNSFRKLEAQSNEVLGKGVVNEIAAGVANVLLEELCDVEDRYSIIDRVASRIADLIAEARNEEYA
ncbi:MAG: hypothetical protein ACYSW8_31225 [Planctomycetota bacterium]